MLLREQMDLPHFGMDYRNTYLVVWFLAQNYGLCTESKNQAKHSKVVYLVLHKLKLMAHMHSVYLHACAFSAPHMNLFRSRLKPATERRTMFADDFKISQLTTANVLALCATIRTGRRLLWSDK